MSDNQKKQLDEFEARLRGMSNDPGVALFLDLISGMSPSAKYDALERQKNLMRISDTLSQSLQQILSSEKSKQLFQEELKKRLGS